MFTLPFTMQQEVFLFYLVTVCPISLSEYLKRAPLEIVDTHFVAVDGKHDSSISGGICHDRRS